MAMSSELPLDGSAISLGSATRTLARGGAVSTGAPYGGLSELEDSALIARAQAGERPAFDALVRRYDRDVLRLILRVVHSQEQASDLYQEAFLRIYRNLHRFRLESSFYTWIYRIVTNVCLDYLRRRRSRPEDQAPAVGALDVHRTQPVDFFDGQQDTRANPEQQLLGQEIGERIAAALQRLSPRERMIFEMKHYQGLKLRAIGEALGTSEETVKNSLFRATQKLRLQLQELC
jgi:RNA polymerase sigma-70 factor (ECF subfamily)